MKSVCMVIYLRSSQGTLEIGLLLLKAFCVLSLRPCIENNRDSSYLKNDQEEDNWMPGSNVSKVVQGLLKAPALPEKRLKV